MTEPTTGGYALRFGDVRTGRLLGRMRASAANGSAGMLGDGSVSVTVAAEQARDLYHVCPGGRGMWALEWSVGTDRRIVDAGVFWPRSVSEDGLTLGGAGILSILNRRVLVPDVAADEIAGSPAVSFTNFDLGSIMRGIVNHVMSLPRGDLPINLEAARSGTHVRTYNGYDLATAGQRILELAEVEPNTEFLFVPRFATGSTTQVVWDFVTGTQSAPQLTNTVPWRLSRVAPNQKVVGEITVEDGADELATDVFAKGDGQEAATMIRSATDTTLTDAGFPRLDAVTTNNSLDGAVVQAYADGELAKVKRGTRGVKVQVSAQWWWSQQRRVGDQVHLTATHRVLGALDFTSRVASVGWNVASPWVDVTLGEVLSEEGF